MIRLAIALLLVGAASTANAQTTIWLWHGDHDLRGLGDEVAVAYLSRTILLSRSGLQVRPRRNRILLDPSTPRIAVVHIEVEGALGPSAFRAAQGELLRAMAPSWREGAQEVQIDFDARASMRAAYASLLDALAETHEDTPLSITALASWCQEQWLSSLPIARAVPMLFGPGHGAVAALARMQNGRFAEARCNEARGLREGQSTPPGTNAIFIFGQGPWTIARVRRALQR